MHPPAHTDLSLTSSFSTVSEAQARIVAQNESLKALGAAINTSPVIQDFSLLRHGFAVGGRNFLIDYAMASALTEMQPIYRLPNTPNWLLGMANLQGVVTPVFDFALYLGIEHPKDIKRMLLTIGRGNDSAAIVIDGTTQLVDLTGAVKLESVNVGEAMQAVVPCVWVQMGQRQQAWYELNVMDWLKHLSEQIVR
jgi:chemotaxis signal transduction protein